MPFKSKAHAAGTFLIQRTPTLPDPHSALTPAGLPSSPIISIDSVAKNTCRCSAGYSCVQASLYLQPCPRRKNRESYDFCLLSTHTSSDQLSMLTGISSLFPLRYARDDVRYESDRSLWYTSDPPSPSLHMLSPANCSLLGSSPSFCNTPGSSYTSSSPHRFFVPSSFAFPAWVPH
eukprot:765272-Hanusia_phi.AAC.3